MHIMHNAHHVMISSLSSLCYSHASYAHSVELLVSRKQRDPLRPRRQPPGLPALLKNVVRWDTGQMGENEKMKTLYAVWRSS